MSSGEQIGDNGAKTKRREAIFALRERLKQSENGSRPSSPTNDDDDDGSSSVETVAAVLTPSMLESTIVPAMKDILKERDEHDNHGAHGGSNNNNSSSSSSGSGSAGASGGLVEERKDASETTQGAAEKGSRDNAAGGAGATEYTIAILECMVSFAALTCSVPPKPHIEPPTTQSSYNSLSFRRSTTTTTTPKKKTNTNAVADRQQQQQQQPASFVPDPKRDKDFFVDCGAFEMAVYLLRQILEEHVARASSSLWSRQKHNDPDALFDSIGVADSSANVRIDSTEPENAIPRLVMQVVACLAHNAGDDLKNDRILPHLATIVHKAMMVFLPSGAVQAYGCWTLSSLSNPLLQELIAAGSVSVLVRAMKRHPENSRVQEHGNKSLYNLLPLLAFCCEEGGQGTITPRGSRDGGEENNGITNHNNSNDNGGGSSINGGINGGINHGSYHNTTHNNNNNHSSHGSSSSSSMDDAAAVCRIELDGEKLEDYSSLLPGLPAIVLRGMDSHPDRLPVQQYGMLVLMRLCQQDQETYEVIVSEGGLVALLNVVTMATRGWWWSSSFGSNDGSGNHHGSSAPALSGYTDEESYREDYANHDANASASSDAEKLDSLAQMACQFLRDLSRPTNSSMDILRIVAVKGGTTTVLKLLHHYNQENLRCGGGGGGFSGSSYGLSNYGTTRFAVNIIDPAMACLRNLMTNEDNRSEVMAAASGAGAEAGGNQNNTGDEDTWVCANILPIVLTTTPATKTRGSARTFYRSC